MPLSSHNHPASDDQGIPVADVLLVCVPSAAIGTVRVDFLTHAESGREALGILKLLRFRFLLASLDVPDMPPWELFRQARRAQARLQCVLLDERSTPEDEQRVREAGAGV